MKSQIKKLKQEKKELAKRITELKSQRKEYRGYVPGLGSAQSEFRIKHIADCLLRGRTKEQIENKWRDPNNYEHKYVWKQAQQIVDSVKEEVADGQEAVCAGA